MDKMQLHNQALLRTIGQLRSRKLQCQVMPVNASPFDLLVGGVARVEVKAALAPLARKGFSATTWAFNLHRHNVLSTDKVDFFALFLPPMVSLGFKNGISLIIPAGDVAGRKAIAITARSLMVRWGKYYDRWDDIKKFCEERKVRP